MLCFFELFAFFSAKSVTEDELKMVKGYRPLRTIVDEESDDDILNSGKLKSNNLDWLELENLA